MPAATRLFDADVFHCSSMVRAVGSPDVFVNSLPWSRMGDVNTPHEFPVEEECETHTAPILLGSVTVFVNGRGAGRMGDPLTPDCTAVAEGSPNVFAG